MEEVKDHQAVLPPHSRFKPNCCTTMSKSRALHGNHGLNRMVRRQHIASLFRKAAVPAALVNESLVAFRSGSFTQSEGVLKPCGCSVVHLQLSWVCCRPLLYPAGVMHFLKAYKNCFQKVHQTHRIIEVYGSVQLTRRKAAGELHCICGSV